MKNFTLPWKQFALCLIALNFLITIHAQTTIYSENFSSGAGGWTDTSTGAGTGDWVIGSNVDHATGATGNYYYSQQYTTNYNNNTYITATSPAIDMTGFTGISLSFDLWIDTEAGWDGLKLEYSLNNGSTWNDLGSVANAGWYNDTDVDAFANGEDGFSGSSGDTWITFSIDLSGEDIGFEAATQARIRVLMASDGSVTDRGAAFDEILIEGTASVPSPEIAITGLGNTINDGDTTPSGTDDTNFGDVGVATGSETHTFTIRNVGTLPLTLTDASPYVVISGANAADFTLTSTPSNSISSGGSTTFNITFNPSALGTRTATISVANNDSDENPYNFSIEGNGIDLCASTVTSFPYNEGFESGLGLVTQDAGDDFDWTRNTNGTPSNNTGPSAAASGSWYLYTEASNGNTNNTSNLETPCFDLSGLTAPEFSFNYHMYGANMGTLNIDISTDGGLTYPTNLWTQTGQVQTSNGQAWNNVVLNLAAYVGQTVKIRIQGITGNSWPSDMAIDDLYLGEPASPSPEIEVTGLGVNIVDGDATPDVVDDTDFGSIDIGSPSTNTYT
ncbi:MAG: choice-of-anchor D domain-containing protein, partial [bacterium]